MIKELNYLKTINALNSRIKVMDVIQSSKTLYITEKGLEALIYHHREYSKTYQPPTNITGIYDRIINTKITGWDLKISLYILCQHLKIKAKDPGL